MPLRMAHRALHPFSLSFWDLMRPSIRVSRALALLSSGLLLSACGGGGGSSETTATAAALASPVTNTTLDATVGTPADTALAAAQAVRSATSSASATVFSGRGWYVDATAGKDTNAGTAAAPWKTLARAARQSLAPGDALLLKCGSLWRESLTLSAANAPNGGATLGAWGTCTADNRPVISGADLITGTTWQSATEFAGRPVYVAAWSQPVTRLHWNGVPLVRARYPNYQGVGHEFKLIAAVNGNTLVPATADALALGTADLRGARVTVRTNPWLAEAFDVASGNAGSGIVLSRSTQYAPQAAQGYVVEGKLALLDSPGEWFQDTATGRLYVWTSSGASPASGQLETLQRDTGLLVSAVADMQVQQIAFERHRQQSVAVVGAKRTLVSGVSSRYADGTGVLVAAASATADSAGSVVQGSTVSHAGTVGISVSGPAMVVSGNQVDTVGLESQSTDVSAGVLVDSAGGTVADNRISQTAYAAIILSQPTGLSVTGNVLTQACRRFTDCGALYTGGAPTQAQRSQISANAISGLAPNLEGTTGSATALVAGIYLDEESATLDLTNNMIARVGVGINLHNAANNLVQGNQVWLARQSSLRVHNSSANDSVRGNLIQDNLLFAANQLVAAADAATAPGTQDVFAQEWVHGSDARLMFGGSNPNVALRNVAGTLGATTAARWSLLGGWTHQRLDLAQWRALAPSDSAQSLYAARPFLVTAGGANLVPNPGLTSPGTGWLFWSPTPAAGGSASFGSCGSSGCADVLPGSASDILSSASFQMTGSGSLFAVRVRVRGVSASTALSMAINRDGGDYAQLGFVSMDTPVDSAADSWIEALFNASSTDAARLNMFGRSGVPFRVRDVLVSPVSGYELFNPDTESELLVNESASARTLACPSTVLRSCNVTGLDGQAVTWPLTLPPRSARVVVSADAKWKPAP